MIYGSFAQLLLQITIYLNFIAQLVLFVCARIKLRQEKKNKEMNRSNPCGAARDSKFALSLRSADVNERPYRPKGQIYSRHENYFTLGGTAQHSIHRQHLCRFNEITRSQ